MLGYKKKTNLKNCGILWVGEIPEHWDMKKFKHFYASSMGNTILKEDLSDEAATPVYSATEYVEILGYIDNPNVILNKDDFIIPARGNSIGHVKLVAEKCTCTQTTIYARSLNPGRINPNFVYWYQIGLRSKLYEFDNTAIPQLTVRQVKENPILVPSPDEQQAIAAFLDRETSRIDALIQKKERMIELLKEKRIALITQAVTKGMDPTVPMKDSGIEWLGEVPEHWEVKAIKRSTPVQRGASPRPIDDPNYFDEEGEYAWVRISDVTESKVFLEKTTQRLSELGSSLSVKLKPGTIFVSIAGTVGIPCITSIKCCIHDGFVYFPKLKMLPKFLYYVFESGEPYKGLGKLGTQLNLNTDTIGSVVIGVPPIHEQQVIVECIDRRLKHIEKLISAVEQSISLLHEYRSSLIHHAVTGKIDLRGYDAQAQ